MTNRRSPQYVRLTDKWMMKIEPTTPTRNAYRLQGNKKKRDQYCDLTLRSLMQAWVFGSGEKWWVCRPAGKEYSPEKLATHAEIAAHQVRRFCQSICNLQAGGNATPRLILGLIQKFRQQVSLDLMKSLGLDEPD